MFPGFRRGSAWVQGPTGADDNGRRSFLKLGAAAAGSVLAGAGAKAAEPGAPPADAPWSLSLGAGVVDRPYGQPSKFERDVIRRNVPWLTGSRESSVSFSPIQNLTGIITPNGAGNRGTSNSSLAAFPLSFAGHDKAMRRLADRL